MKADIRNPAGGTALSQDHRGGWGEGKMAASQADWQPRRIGANPPAVLPTLLTDVFGAVHNACGEPVSLATHADGTSQRESFHRFLTTGPEPLGELVADELSHKLDTPGIRFDSTGTYTHDPAGRAQAFRKLVQSGIDTDRALANSGLIVDG